MSSQTFAYGNEVAPEFRDSSLPSDPVQGQLSTVHQLLLKVDAQRGPKKLSGLWTTARHIAECAQVSVEEMPIEALRRATPEYQVWLRGRRYSPKSVDTFLYNLRKLQAYADEYCSSGEVARLREAWALLQAALEANGRAPKSIPAFAISKNIAPADFSNEDLERWATWMFRRGRKLRTLKLLKWQFRRTIVNAKLEHLLPSLRCRTATPKYSADLEDMPAELRAELSTLLQWKQARFARGRPSRGQHRATSAKLLEQHARRLYGFAVNVAHLGEISSLEALFSERVVNAFVDWAMNDRRLSKSSLTRLSLIAAAMKHHPKYEKLDLSWFDALMSDLPKDDEAARLERKRKKYIPHEILVTIPEKMRVAACKQKDPVQKAWYAHDQLLLLWFTVLPWRQENLRECRIGESNVPNVFFGPLQQLVHIAKPKWAQDELKLNPQRSFWQFQFSKDETKIGRPVRGFLPRRLIGPLETYVSQHRALLARTPDPGTLFLNREGGALTQQLVTDLVGQITFQYAGTLMTPHLFRDAFAYAWLDAHPEDYLSLSKVLWHVSLEYTLKVYGRGFDESNGASRVDEWFG